MLEAVRPNGLTFRLDPPRFGRERLRHLAHHKKRRLDALRGFCSPAGDALSRQAASTRADVAGGFQSRRGAGHPKRPGNSLTRELSGHGGSD